jgi:hypothetical protein
VDAAVPPSSTETVGTVPDGTVGASGCAQPARDSDASETTVSILRMVSS